MSIEEAKRHLTKAGFESMHGRLIERSPGEIFIRVTNNEATGMIYDPAYHNFYKAEGIGLYVTPNAAREFTT